MLWAQATFSLRRLLHHLSLFGGAPEGLRRGRRDDRKARDDVPLDALEKHVVTAAVIYGIVLGVMWAPLIVTVVIVVALVAMLIFKEANKSTPAAAAPTPIAAAPAAPAAASSSKPKRAAKSPAPAAKSPTPPAKSPAKSPAPAPAPAPVSLLAALTHQPDRNGGLPSPIPP
jgi:cell division septation protein DedD